MKNFLIYSCRESEKETLIHSPVSRTESLRLPSYAAADLLHGLRDLLQAEPDGVARDGLQLVQSPPSDAQTAAGDHRHLQATGGQGRG